MTNSIGNLLKHLRETRGLLLREVGALLDINPTILSKIECGNRFPTRNQISTLASFYVSHREEIMTIWLCEKLLFEIKEEEYALPAIHAVMKRLKKFNMRLTDIENIDWDFNTSSSDPLSGIHPYPAKFIPEIPGLLLDTLDVPQGSVVLDPFCGSGVTLVESQKRGLESIGIDINPIACLLSEVKTKPLPLKTSGVADSIINTCISHIGPIYIPPIPNLDHWFKKDIQEALALLIFEINKLDDSVVKNALRLCFSSIIVKVSNQDSDTRYAAVDKKWVKEDVYAFFSQSVTRLVKIKRNMTTSNAPVTVLNKNSLNLQGKDFDKKIGIVITSPPYPNAYEYWLYHKYRMWWLGFDPIDVKEHEIGARAHYFKKNHQTIDDFIQQMETLFESFKLLCIKNAYVCFVIGRSKIHGEIIENEKLIQSIGENKGFSHITTITRTIRSNRKSFNLSHARIKEEYIVILQNK